MHLSKGFTIYCTTCAYLHDIGKLFIPSEILQKAGTLTPEEREIMKKHTIHGYNLCMKDLKLRPYATGTLNHHEALDGSGYPNGLSSHDIPLEAQIISVADQFEAIVSKRQYKSHVDISDALKIVIEDTKPSSTSEKKVGKLNKSVVKKLLKVVLDDIYLEISYTEDYVEALNRELDRFKEIEKYIQKMNSAKDEKEKNYYLEGVQLLLKKDETLESYPTIYKEYSDAYTTRKNMIDKLYEEIKIIKKLHV